MPPKFDQQSRQSDTADRQRAREISVLAAGPDRDRRRERHPRSPGTGPCRDGRRDPRVGVERQMRPVLLLSARSAPLTPGGPSRLHFQDLHRFHGLRPSPPGSASPRPRHPARSVNDAAGFTSRYGPHRCTPPNRGVRRWAPSLLYGHYVESLTPYRDEFFPAQSLEWVAGITTASPRTAASAARETPTTTPVGTGATSRAARASPRSPGRPSPRTTVTTGTTSATEALASPRKPKSRPVLWAALPVWVW